MKKISFILAITSVMLFLSVSCGNNNNVDTQRSYSKATFVNASDYYMLCYVDGEKVFELGKGEKYAKNFGVKFSYTIRIDLHEETDATHYKKDASKTHTTQQQFYSNLDYKITVTNDKVYTQSNYAN